MTINDDHEREELIINAVMSWNDALGRELRRLIEHRRNSYYYVRRDMIELRRQLDEKTGAPSHVHD